MHSVPSASAYRQPITGVVVENDDVLRAAICATLAAMGMDATGCADVEALAGILDDHEPGIVFLDVGLRNCDAVNIFALLAARRYPGMVQLLSGRDSPVLEYARLAGEAHGLRMRPVIVRPIRSSDIGTTMPAPRQRALTRRPADRQDAGMGRDWLPEPTETGISALDPSVWRPVRLADLHRYRDVARA